MGRAAAILLLATTTASFACSTESSEPPISKAPETTDAGPSPKKVDPSPGAHDLAVALVLDRSGSMSGQKIDMTKAAAKEVSEALRSNELLDVVAFDATPVHVVKMRPGNESATSDVAIDAIGAGGGTDIVSALDVAYGDLSDVSATHEHVILVTDGQSPSAGLDELSRAMAAESITVSTIALGVDADERMLRSIADAGGGRFYRVVDPTKLPAVFAQELAIVRKSAD